MPPNALLLRPCVTDDQLHAWVRLFTGLDVPRSAVCQGHDAPFDYLRLSYFEPSRDLVVWAPRGGGKTRLAAVATLLDLLHKPPVSVRILGGSLEQSMKMWDYLLPDLDRLARSLLVRRLRDSARRIRLSTGANAAVLTQSQRAVRGLRVQKLRCDEVELFDPKIWQAAQLTTRSITPRLSGATTPGSISGAIEALSTLHSAHGLMGRVVDQARSSGTRILRWCLMEVLERCPPERECGACPLLADCAGRAKSAGNGFVRIDDAIRMKRRVSSETWESEMLCRRPGTRGMVFPTFDPQAHVRPWDGTCEGVALGIDFGFAAPFVALWIAERSDGSVHVFDEHVQAGLTVAQHLRIIAARPWPRPGRIFCDPAGAGPNAQTATSDVQLLRQAGYTVRHRASRIVDGLEKIRAALSPAAGTPRLLIDPRCRHLIAALGRYRYPEAGGEIPLKDGEHDHLIDALRYFYVNTQAPQRLAVRRY